MEMHTKENVEPARFTKAIEIVRRESEYRYTVETEKAGGTHYINSRVSGIWSLNRELIGFVLMSEDVTERKRAEEKLTEYSDELERSNQELQDFANIVSHDLHEPLRKVHAFGERLQAKYAECLGEQGNDYLRRMHGATARMQILIDDLLTFSRVTTRVQPPGKVDMNRVAREVIKDLETRIMDTGGRVEVADLPEIEADAFHMHQLLQNLIGNGLKFNCQGMPPVVMVSGACEDGNGKCRIVVEDNGIGIEEQYRDRIFEGFKRLHTWDEYEGTGMGLAICKKIAEHHGGGITIEGTQQGHGARFIVVLNQKTVG